MKPTALVCSEPIRPCMGGIGIRYFEFARRLSERGLDIVLLSPGETSDIPEVPFCRSKLRRFEPGTLAAQVADCGCVVAQGQWANELAGGGIDQPLVIDLYDPFLIENLHYAASMGPELYHNDLATWRLQMERGDFFLCASEAQRLYYLGFFTALGRIGADRISVDPDMRGLIDVVPYGTEHPSSPHHPVLPPRTPDEKRILFCGMYDWYDPWPVLHALDEKAHPSWSLIFMRHPSPDVTPQSTMRDIERWAEEPNRSGMNIQFHDWVPAARRFDLLQDVDLMVVPHSPGIETCLSLRTRMIDALSAGCPVVASSGGTMSDILETNRAGWIVPAGDGAGLREAIEQVLAGGDKVGNRQTTGRRVATEYFGWDSVLEPLLRFCRNPARDDANPPPPAPPPSPPPEPPPPPAKGWFSSGVEKVSNFIPRISWRRPTPL